MKIGESVTLTTKLLMEYVCSNCGKETKSIDKVVTTGHTEEFFGIQSNRGYIYEAREDMRYELEELLEYNNAQRYRDKKFTCRCQNCGYREPWARMSFSATNNLLTLCKALTILSAFPLIPVIASQNWIIVGIISALLIGSLVAKFFIKRYQKKHIYEMEYLICRLPKTAIPKISVQIGNGFVPLELLFAKKKTQVWH